MNLERSQLRMSAAPQWIVIRRAHILASLFFRVLGSLALLSLTAAAAASTITGTVINRTTGLPSVGDEVLLYRVDRSMHLASRTKSDSRGEFRFALPGHIRYLIAASHQAVSYHTSVLTGDDPVEMSVYEATPSRKDVHEQSDTLFLEDDRASLKVTEFFVLSNETNRTVAANDTFDFALPRRAVLDSVAIQAPNTLPVLAAAIRGWGHRYSIHQPLRPGITKVRAVYHLPYPGHALLTTTPLQSVATMALMVPKSMQIASEIPRRFAYRGEQNRLAMYVASDLHAGMPVAFRVVDAGSPTTDVSEMIAQVTSAQIRSDLPTESRVAGRGAVTAAANPRIISSPASLSWHLPLLAAMGGACAAAMAAWKFRRPLPQKT